MSLQDLKQVLPEPLELLLPEDLHDSQIPKSKNRFWKSLINVLAQTQKYSAYGFLGFFGIHIASTVVVPGLGINAETSQDFFEMCRNVYLGPVFETTAVFGTVGIHLASGILLRFCRQFNRTRRFERSGIVIKDGARDDIGLGGVGSIFGLGFKKSWISSNFPSLTPLTFSGYVLAGALAYHYAKLRLAPILVDGDSSLVTLKFVTHYLRQSCYGNLGTAINLFMLALLLWVSFYHTISGLFRYRRQFSMRAKKIAYGVIGTMAGLSFVAILRMRQWDLDPGFMGKQFALYLYIT